jgi:EAL domain-containing protein (putative c-di-GMP-specific phosphodiesterase class I)
MAMATFARRTGAYVIAEGIEDEATLAYLQGIDDLDLRRIIQGGQGYGLGRPSPTIQTTLTVHPGAARRSPLLAA